MDNLHKDNQQSKNVKSWFSKCFYILEIMHDYENLVVIEVKVSV